MDPISSFTKYVLDTCCEEDTLLGAGDLAESKIEEIPAFTELTL